MLTKIPNHNPEGVRDSSILLFTLPSLVLKAQFEKYLFSISSTAYQIYIIAKFDGFGL
jgi:hypothetical protein